MISRVISSYLGFANYYNRLISNFAKITSPISKLSGKHEIVWEDEQKSAFEALKLKLMSAPVLALPNFD